MREHHQKDSAKYTHVCHEFAPVYDSRSQVLILGSLPSAKSRENHFYYGHPQNRFWRLLALLYKTPVPETTEEKRAMLLKNRIALWDVIASCDIIGSSDSSIRNVTAADLGQILNAAPIQLILANGTAAFKLYQKYCQEQTGREAVLCPSTSPANAAFTLEKLKAAWGRHLPLA
ncbi:MAG: DNA-deoxyinosine glycosylase [Eubacteriales bacterium]|nr:DNA-deoxyinosine glycosylase [Eubacteriales bacterium]